MRSIINSISIYLVAGAISLPGVLYTQSDDDRKCLKIKSELFEAMVIPKSQDNNPHHDHGGVILRGRYKAILLYMRSHEGPFERANSMVKEMNRAFAIGHKPNIEVYSPSRHPRESTRGREWRHDEEKPASHWKRWSIWQVEYEDGKVEHPHELVTIYKGDVAGFQNRAPGGDRHDPSAAGDLSLKPANEIDHELVANWWGANLSDLLSMFICSEEPTRTLGTFAGEVYERIYREAREHHPKGIIPLDVWRDDVIAVLNKRDLIALRRVGQFIPEDFGHHDDDHDDDND